MKLLYPLAKRFIAGHDFDSAKPVIQKLIEQGYDVSIDYLGELSTTEEQCDLAEQQYFEIIDYYDMITIDISIKITQLGLKINKHKCYERLERIVQKAYVCGHTVRLDMEDSAVTGDTVDVCLRAHEKYKNIGIALQCNLHRTKDDINALLNAGVSIRLVKGAYKEDITIAHQKNYIIEEMFLFQALKLLSHRLRSYNTRSNDITPVPAIGTHDEDLIEKLLNYGRNFNMKKTDFDIEMLYGIRRDLSSSLHNSGYSVRLYVPFGTDWLPYTLRRLKEFKNMKFVFTNVFKEIFS